MNSFLAHLDSVLADCAAQPENAVTKISKVPVKKRVKSDYLVAERLFWERELKTSGLGTLGGFIVRPPTKLPAFEPHKPRPPLSEQPPGKPTPPDVWRAVMSERKDKTLGQVRDVGRPKPRRYEKVPLSRLNQHVVGNKLRSRTLSMKERLFLLGIGDERGHRGRMCGLIALAGYQPATLEGPNGAYLNLSDRSRHRKCAGMDSDNQQHAESSRSVFPAYPVPHAPYRSTGDEAFARRIEEHRAKVALEEMRIPSAGMQWAVMECAVKGRRPGDVIESREDICLNTLKSHVERMRTAIFGERPVKKRELVAREPIAYKSVVINGVMHTIKVYPPKGRKTQFARRTK